MFSDLSKYSYKRKRTSYSFVDIFSQCQLQVELFLQNGGGVAVVNSGWFTPIKKEVFWPPYKEQNKCDKALRLSEAVDSEKWKL